MVLGGGLLAMPATAGDWTLSNSISLQTVFTDNVALREDADTGVILDVAPRLDLVGKGGRVSGNLAYAPAVYARFGGDTDDQGINHFLNAAFAAELVRDTLFLDTKASAGLTTVDASTNLGPDARDYRDESSQVYTFSISPYSQHRFGSQASLLARLTADRVGNSGGGAGGSIDSTGLGAELRLSSGARFARLPWSISATRRENRYDDRTDQRDAINGSLGYRINRLWRVDGSVGYESNDVVTQRQDTDGLVYSGTVFWTPTPRTNVQAQVGQRYFGTFWNVQADHRSRRTSIGFSMSRDVSNTRSLVIDEAFLQDLADAGIILPPGIVPVTLRNEDFLTDRASLDLKVTGRRTNIGLVLSWDDRTYELSGDDEQVARATLSASRRITPQLSATLRTTYRDVQNSATNDSEYIDYGLGLSRRLGRESTLAFDLSRRERFSDTAEEYTEHRLSITLTMPMF